jgi:hypothetical protein
MHACPKCAPTFIFNSLYMSEHVPCRAKAFPQRAYTWHYAASCSSVLLKADQASLNPFSAMQYIAPTLPDAAPNPKPQTPNPKPQTPLVH